ncbi:putative glutaredoxin, partial [Hygrophoropsis aurantiaca]
FSRAVIQVLDLHGVPVEKFNPWEIFDGSDIVYRYMYREWPMIPQLYLNGEFVGGCNIFLGIHQSGELESLLEQN